MTPQPQQRRKYKLCKQEVKDAQDAKSAKSAEFAKAVEVASSRNTVFLVEVLFLLGIGFVKQTFKNLSRAQNKSVSN